MDCERQCARAGYPCPSQTTLLPYQIFNCGRITRIWAPARTATLPASAVRSKERSDFAWRCIFSRHAEDQGPYLRAHTPPPAHSSSSGEPFPVQPKARSMPSHNRLRCDQHERLLPAGPESPQNNPEQLVHGRQSRTRSLGVQSQQLLTEREVFEKEILTGAERANHPANEVPERAEHNEILSQCRITPSLQVIHLTSAGGFDEAQGTIGLGVTRNTSLVSYLRSPARSHATRCPSPITLR
jgi:hypothetical protein